MSNTKNDQQLRNQWIAGWNIGRYGGYSQRKHANHHDDEWQLGFTAGNQERTDALQSASLFERGLRLLN